MPQLEAASFWFRNRNELIRWSLMRYFPHAESMLELGCGTGFVLAGLYRALPHLRLTGSEISSRGLSVASRRLPGVDLVQMDARAIPYRDEFDVVGAFDVLEHIDEDERVLAEIGRALRPGGGLLLTVPQHPWLWSEIDVTAHHVRRYRRSDLAAKVRRAGFEVVAATSFVSLALPAMIVSRLGRSKAAPGHEELAELELAPWIDRLLDVSVACERVLIRAGFSWPCGGSLLLVAVRSGESA